MRGIDKLLQQLILLVIVLLCGGKQNFTDSKIALRNWFSW